MYIDIKNQKFGYLTCVEYVGRVGKYKLHTWKCVCDCGNYKNVYYSNLIKGKTKSCGCFAKKSKSCRKFKHGMRHTPEFNTWSKMKQRCLNSNSKGYYLYGGRGIKVCDEWLDKDKGFINFYNCMGPKPSKLHSIDRIDVNGNYEPNNCRWATNIEQQRNRRNNKLLTHKNKTLCLSEWAEVLNVPIHVLESQLRKTPNLGDSINTINNRKIQNQQRETTKIEKLKTNLDKLHKTQEKIKLKFDRQPSNKIIPINLESFHSKKAYNFKDLSGERFGKLIVLYIGKKSNNKKSYFWICKCDCGNYKEINYKTLTAGNAISCGCYKKQLLHTHGMTKHKIISLYYSLKSRCFNKSSECYSNYGGRGVSLCERWLEINNFIEDMLPSYKDGDKLKRKDLTKDFSPDNCFWKERNPD